MPRIGAETGKPESATATEQPSRRLSDKVLLAFDQACEQRDLSAAEQLVRVLEMTHRRGREMVTLIAAYERLWKLQHNIWKPSRVRAQSARGHASNFAGDVAEPKMFELAAELEAQATAAYIRGADQA